MTSDDVDLLADAYAALLRGGAGVDVIAYLAEDGIDLEQLLIGPDGLDRITRSDATELAAAAALMAVEKWDLDKMFMPNVPKMSRRKSDSGIDVLQVRMHGSSETLANFEFIDIASVKHTVSASTGGLRRSLEASLLPPELSAAYLATQLRVVHGRLVEQGMDKNEASRVYRFIRDFPISDRTNLFGVAVVDTNATQDLLRRLRENSGSYEHWSRALIISIPDIDKLQDRCA